MKVTKKKVNSLEGQPELPSTNAQKGQLKVQ
jgi:hypothetical protein